MFHPIHAPIPQRPSASDNGEQQEITAPVVFQCAKCHLIVGDSLSFASSDESAQTITLSSASHVQRSAEVYTSKSGKDVGSTYFSFSCTGCKNTLGKFYITTSRTIDTLREKFTFDVRAMSSYVLGQSEHGINTSDALNEAIENSNNNNNNNSPAAFDEMGETNKIAMEEKITDLSQEVVRIEHVMLSLTERVQLIEQRLSLPHQINNSPPTSEPKSHTKRQKWEH